MYILSLTILVGPNVTSSAIGFLPGLEYKAHTAACQVGLKFN